MGLLLIRLRIEPSGIGYDVVSLGFGISSILFVVCCSVFLSKLRPMLVLTKLGGKSMHVYLMHILIGSGVRIALQKFLHITNPWIHIGAGVFVATLLPVVMVSKIKLLTKMYLFSPPPFLSAKRYLLSGSQK